MARQIVTQSAVNEAAAALVTEGQEPSIVGVQERIGGGSYSTVKRFLDVWRDERSQVIAQAPETPPDVQAKGLEFARTLWALASLEARKETEQIKADASAAMTKVSGDLAEARSVIARMEGVETDLSAQVEALQSTVRDKEVDMAVFQVQALRVPELEQMVAELRKELQDARQAVSAKVFDEGRVYEELEALRRQVQDLMAAINQPK